MNTSAIPNGTPAATTRNATGNAMLTDAVILLDAIATRSVDLAASLPQLDLPPDALACAAGELQRLAVRLAAIEDRLAAEGPVSAVVRDVVSGLVVRWRAG
jgi:hypothetical protein